MTVIGKAGLDPMSQCHQSLCCFGSHLELRDRTMEELKLQLDSHALFTHSRILNLDLNLLNTKALTKILDYRTQIVA